MKRRQQQRQKPASTPVWIGSILFITAFIGGVYWLAWRDRNVPPVSYAENAATEQHTATKKTTHATQPRFEFYNALPNKPEVTTAQEAKEPTTPALAQYILQVAAISHYQDADKLKAELLLQGYDVRVDRLTTPRGELYRVSVGPYESLRQAEQAQVTLQQQHFAGIVRRVV